jgi:hypothetical protein
MILSQASAVLDLAVVVMGVATFFLVIVMIS